MVWQIHIRKPFARSVSLVQAILILLFVVGISFWLGTKSLGLPFLGDPALSGITDKNEKIRLLEKSNMRLKNEVELAKRSTEVESVAAGEMKSMLQEKEVELLKLAQELQFYRTLYSPDADNSAVQVRGFLLREDVATGQYDYRVTLTGMPKRKENVSGRVRLSVAGERQGVPTVLRPEAIHETEKDAGLKFSFRYFQEIAGSLSLPEDFLPASVQVEVLRNGSKQEPLIVSYLWDEAYVQNGVRQARSEE